MGAPANFEEREQELALEEGGGWSTHRQAGEDHSGRCGPEGKEGAVPPRNQGADIPIQVEWRGHHTIIHSCYSPTHGDINLQVRDAKCRATGYACGHKSLPLIVAKGETLVEGDRHEFGVALVGCGIVAR